MRMIRSMTSKACVTAVFAPLLFALVTLPTTVDCTADVYSILVKASDAFITSDVDFTTEHEGYTGSGYLDFQKQYGYIEWEVDVEYDALYDIIIRYAAASDRPSDLFIGDNVEVPFDFTTSGGWNDWSTETHQVMLEKGIHIFHLEATQSSGPNVDSMTLVTYDPVDNDPPSYDPIFIEAEESSTLSDVGFSTQHEGYTGTGYLDFQKQDGFVEWEVELAVDATYNIVIRYASAGDRPSELFIGNSIDIPFDFTPTGGWQDWSTETHQAQLSKGVFTLRLEATQSSGANVDSITLEPINPNNDDPPTDQNDTDDNQDQQEDPPTNPQDENDNQDQQDDAPPDEEDTSPIFIEAEDSLTMSDVDFSTQHIGYTGSGYLDFRRQNGFIEWEIDILQDATYDIVLRYAAGGSSGRPSDLFIGDGMSIPFDFSSTGSWENWSTETNQASLQSGTYIFRLEATQSSGANIDSMTLIPKSPNDDPPTDNDDPDPPIDEDDNNNNGVVPPPPIIDYAKTVVLEKGTNIAAGDLKKSPNNTFKFGLNNNGDLVLFENNNKIWSAGITGGAKLYLQNDGNLIVRKSNNKALWTSNTHGVDNTQLVIDDGGRVAVTKDGVAKWLVGKPRGEYKGPSSPDLQFPIRGAFYYAWYKETWTVNGALVHAEPTLSYYRSDDPDVAEQHIKALDYAHVDLSIISWWGPTTTLEAARIALLLDKTRELNSNLKWSIYHEDEKHFDYTPSMLIDDLEYLKTNYAWHPSFGHKDGKPIIFVYNESGCEVATRWKQANEVAQWYVVLKLFPGFEGCSDQPDSWHEYGPGSALTVHQPWSTSISPGFWRADRSSPKLDRLEPHEFRPIAVKMVDNNDDWQLLTTFNEHGEGTAMESSEGWESPSGFGEYLDILHDVY